MPLNFSWTPLHPLPRRAVENSRIVNANDSKASGGAFQLQPFDADLWYQYVAPVSGCVSVSLCETGEFDSILAVYGGGATCACAPGNPTPLTCGDDTCGVGGGPSRVIFDGFADRCYAIRVGGWNGATGFADMMVEYVPAPDPEQAVPGDCDENLSLTLADQAGFDLCMLGPQRPWTFCCDCADLDGDGRVSLADFALRQNLPTSKFLR